MQVLRGVLIVLIAVFLGYTFFVVADHGVDFLTPFAENVFAVNWSGQFNLDFLSYLVLSALWVAWRHGFSGGGLVLAGLSGGLGFMFFAPYLLVQAMRTDSLKALVLGVQADR